MTPALTSQDHKMTDTPEVNDVEGLLEIARAATQHGPWKWALGRASEPTQWALSPGILLADGTDGTPGGDSRDKANALHIATFDPPTVTSLLTRLQAAEARNAELVGALRPFADFRLGGFGPGIMLEVVPAYAGNPAPRIEPILKGHFERARLALSVLDNRGEDGSSYAARPQTAQEPSELQAGDQAGGEG